MRSGAAIRAVVLALLLLGTTTLGHTQDPALAESGGPDAPIGYTVERAAISGGSYRLSTLAWHVSGTASGGGYRLLEPASATLRGSGCCCTYLPCVLENLR